MKKAIVSVVLLLAVGGGGYLYHEATTPYRTLPAIQVSAAQAGAAERKLNAIWSAGGVAKTTGKAAPVTESFTDSELTSLANQKLQGHSIPLDNVIVHATANGTIESQAKAHWGGQTTPLYLVAIVQVVDGNEPQLKIVQSKTGRLDVPQALTDQINSLIGQSLNLGPASSIYQLKVTITDGLLTISGVAKPA